MRQLIAIALLIAPWSVHADVVRVEYHGVVDYTEVPQYRVGDTIKGTLLIDLLLAPADQFPDNPASGSYSRFLAPGQPDWVTGHNPSGAGNAHDRIFTRNEPGDDSFSIGDLRDLGSQSFRALEISVGGIEFMSSDVLDQAFSVTRKDRPGVFHGSLEWGWEQTRRWVGFALKSVKVTPGRCLAT